jgi:Ca2+-binding RTX toxin-like protein
VVGDTGSPLIGESQTLDASNFNLYAGLADLTAAQAQLGSFVSNSVNTDGGYFPQQINTGGAGSYIEISNIDVALQDTDVSESISAIEIRDIPVGATLTDGVNPAFIATVGNTTVDLLTDSWDLDNIQILSDSSFIGTFDLTIAATSEDSNGSMETSTETLTVTVLDPSSSGIDPDIATALTTTDNGEFIIGTPGDDAPGGNGTLTGTGGNDAIYGGAGDDRIRGGVGSDAGDDFLAGEEGNDTLLGQGGDDILFGAVGSDTMTGGNDADTFLWQAGDADGSIDSITDFDASEGDVLDISDLLQGEDSATIDQYLTVTDTGSNEVTITVDEDGDGSGINMTVVIEGIDFGSLGVDSSAVLQQLLSDGNLNIDQ